MSEIFEKSIQEWYDKSRVAGLDYLNLELPKPNLVATKESISFYCFHKTKIPHITSSENPHLNFISDNLLSLENNISRTFDQVNLGSRTCLKHIHQIHKTPENHENHLEIIKNNQNQILRKLSQLGIEAESHKPLNTKQASQLVEQITEVQKQLQEIRKVLI
jgi:demethoxyubiquinone hydroxylase (CLK1/Coq7/Cat5 family)